VVGAGTSDVCLLGFTQAGGRFDERIQHALKIEGRAADHLEHVGGRDLLLQRVSKLLSRVGEFSASLVKLLFEIRRGPATARTCRRLTALDPRRFLAARLHTLPPPSIGVARRRAWPHRSIAKFARVRQEVLQQFCNISSVAEPRTRLRCESQDGTSA